MLFPTVSPPSTFSVASISLLPHRALPKLFPMVSPPRPPYRRFRIAPSQRSSPSHRSSPPSYFPRFPPVHPVVISVSLLPTGALHQLFPTVSLPSTLSSLPYRSFPTQLSPSFPMVSLPSTLSSLPYRSFPPELSQSYFPRFPPAHPLVTPVSPQAISHGFPPSTLSSLRYRSFPPELSPYFHGFPSVHPFVASVSLPCDKVTKREPKHRRCFWEKTFYAQTNSPA